MLLFFVFFFFFKQKTAYEMRISDWSSDVCSSDLRARSPTPRPARQTSASCREPRNVGGPHPRNRRGVSLHRRQHVVDAGAQLGRPVERGQRPLGGDDIVVAHIAHHRARLHAGRHRVPVRNVPRSEEQTSELQSLMRISYAVFCLKKKKTKQLEYMLLPQT